MNFDGVVSKEGAAAGSWIRPPSGEPKMLSYKLYFDCTNNIAEYEALVLGLRALKDLRAKKIDIYGDSELVVKQFQGSYQSKHPRLRSYRNLVLDLLQGFKEHQLTVIPRKENVAANALAVSASVFQVPKHPNEQYQIEVKHKPSILANVDHWQVSKDDK
jgi:ribonuclease HI